jgi:hypothetical protein
MGPGRVPDVNAAPGERGMGATGERRRRRGDNAQAPATSQ